MSFCDLGALGGAGGKEVGWGTREKPASLYSRKKKQPVYILERP